MARVNVLSEVTGKGKLGAVHWRYGNAQGVRTQILIGEWFCDRSRVVCIVQDYLDGEGIDPVTADGNRKLGGRKSCRTCLPTGCTFYRTTLNSIEEAEVIRCIIILVIESTLINCEIMIEGLVYLK